jgi:hypothetical protein
MRAAAVRRLAAFAIEEDDPQSHGEPGYLR